MSHTPFDHLATPIANNASWDHRTSSLALIRLLANGEPVSRAQLAAVLHQSEEIVYETLRQFGDVVFDDEEGRIVGAGLSLLPTPYRFEIQGHELFTWCALDTLIYPSLLGHPAKVSSACPVTGTPIHLTVTPEGIEHLDPPSGVISLLLQQEEATCCSIPDQEAGATCCSIRDAFCAQSQFFASRQAASIWQASHPDGHVLSIEEAFTLRQELARLTVQRFQDGER